MRKEEKIKYNFDAFFRSCQSFEFLFKNFEVIQINQ